jgi:septum formation protein
MYILASNSPRRRELLNMLALDFQVVPSEIEESIPAGEPPELATTDIAMEKALDAAKRVPQGSIVIGADTLVYLDGSPLGKPRDDREAARMLRLLSGRTHRVYTGVAVIDGDRRLAEYERTDVTFREIDDDEIESYIKTGEPLDKAGAYGIQGWGSLFVERIRGDYYNVVGLPVFRLGMMLRYLGHDVLTTKTGEVIERIP